MRRSSLGDAPPVCGHSRQRPLMQCLHHDRKTAHPDNRCSSRSSLDGSAGPASLLGGSISSAASPSSHSAEAPWFSGSFSSSAELSSVSFGNSGNDTGLTVLVPKVSPADENPGNQPGRPSYAIGRSRPFGLIALSVLSAGSACGFE